MANLHQVALDAAALIDHLNELVEEDPETEFVGTSIVVAYRSGGSTEVASFSTVTPLSAVKMLTRAIALEGRNL